MEKHNTLRIVAIDDNQDNLMVLKAVVLDAFGQATVLTALEGTTGIELARVHDPDLILLDIVMPGIDGYEVCRRIKNDEQLRQIPVVFLTAIKTGRESRIRALDAGAEGFLAKPIDEAELTAQIRAMVKIKAAHLRKQSEKDHLAALVAERTGELEKELSERLKAQQILEQNESELRDIYQSVPLMLCLSDNEGKVDRINRAFADFIAQSGREFREGCICDALGCEKAPVKKACTCCVDHSSCPVCQTVHKTYNTGQPYRRAEASLTLVHGSGQRNVKMLVSPTLLHVRGHRCVLVCFEDVTEHWQMEAQLRHAQKMEAIGQLAGGIAHDFNNILAAMMMNVSLLKHEAAQTAGMREYLNELMGNTERAARLTRQLLLFSRRQVMQPKVLDLSELVSNLIKMLRRLLGEHIELVFQEQGTMYVEADPGMMEQVLMNLCVNARDAMPKGGRLTLRITCSDVEEMRSKLNPEARPGQFICLSVEDTGCGMDEATLKRIFEPFFTTKEVGKGTGLGLATIYGIIKQHQGWVEVESAVGRGTVFRVYLPTSSNADNTRTCDGSAQQLPRGNETILLVEDESAVRRMLALFFRNQGYTVLESQNGVEAQRMWQQHQRTIDLLFTDMVMPAGVSGLDLARQFRALKPELKVIIFSGYSIDLLGQPEEAHRSFTYLPKPCEPEQLAATVRTLLDRK